MKRIVIGSSYKMGFMDMSDAFNFKKNLCASSQELEFLKAVRQFFPNLHAYPNLPLRNFINLESMGVLADDSMRRFCWGSQVDVLLCTEDEDPVAGIELDSIDPISIRLKNLTRLRLRPTSGMGDWEALMV